MNLENAFAFECELRNSFQQIIGIDEVGRGAVAGPLVLAAVEITQFIDGIFDSKQVAAKKRSSLAAQISGIARVSYYQRDSFEIDKLGIAVALKECYLQVRKDFPNALLLTDYYKLPKPYLTSIHGDSRFYSCAAASIVAKVRRDSIMQQLAEKYPVYSWESNVGYGTIAHLNTVRRYGACNEHRRTFLKKYTS